jgi:DNA-binding NarL/FixJ family response regulator
VVDYIRAEKAISKKSPDIIIINTDLKGELNGYETAKYLKLDYDIPFIIVQEEDSYENAKWSAELNPDASLFLNNSDDELLKGFKMALS